MNNEIEIIYQFARWADQIVSENPSTLNALEIRERANRISGGKLPPVLLDTLCDMVEQRIAEKRTKQ